MLHLRGRVRSCFYFYHKVVELVGAGSVINGATPSSLGFLQ